MKDVYYDLIPLKNRKTQYIEKLRFDFVSSYVIGFGYRSSKLVSTS